jgi:hypothetical protein
MAPLLLRGIGQESADSGELARRRRSAEATAPAIREEGPHVGSAEIEQARGRNLLAAIAPEEFDQPVSSGDIGAHRVGRAAAVVLEMAGPLRDQRLGRVN